MSPILGIYASQISGHLWEPAGGYDALWSTTLSASTSSITISNIPSTYKHLQIRAISRQTSTGVNAYFQFNSDTSSANYTQHQLAGNGASASASGTATGTLSGAYLFYGASSSQGANVFGAAVIDILDYSNTNKYKTGRSLSGYDSNGSGVINLTSALWLSTSAISSITVLPQSANFAQYTQFALYGIK